MQKKEIDSIRGKLIDKDSVLYDWSVALKSGNQQKGQLFIVLIKGKILLKRRKKFVHIKRPHYVLQKVNKEHLTPRHILFSLLNTKSMWDFSDIWAGRKIKI